MFHFDGEFASLRALVRETLLGRNYGWLPSERKQAIAHIARVIRNDNGTGELAHEFGGSYRRVLGGTDDKIPEELVLPRKFRVNVLKASDEAIVEGVARLISRYVEQLEFATDDGVRSRARRSTCSCCATTCRASRRRASRAIQYTRRLARGARRALRAALRRGRRRAVRLPRPAVRVRRRGARGPAHLPARARRAEAGRPGGRRRQLRRVPPRAVLHRLLVPQHRDHSGRVRRRARRRRVRSVGHSLAQRARRRSRRPSCRPTPKHPRRHRPLPRRGRRREPRAHGPGRLEHSLQHRLPEGAGPAEEGDRPLERREAQEGRPARRRDRPLQDAGAARPRPLEPVHAQRLARRARGRGRRSTSGARRSSAPGRCATATRRSRTSTSRPPTSRRSPRSCARSTRTTSRGSRTNRRMDLESPTSCSPPPAPFANASTWRGPCRAR